MKKMLLTLAALFAAATTAFGVPDTACGVDLSGLLSAKGDAEALGRALGEFRQKVYAEFDAKFPDAKADFSATKLAIMKNVFVHSRSYRPESSMPVSKASSRSCASATTTWSRIATRANCWI